MDTSATILSRVKQYWGFESLRPLKAEAILAGLEGRDSLVGNFDRPNLVYRMVRRVQAL